MLIDCEKTLVKRYQFFNESFAQNTSDKMKTFKNKIEMNIKIPLPRHMTVSLALIFKKKQLKLLKSVETKWERERKRENEEDSKCLEKRSINNYL